MRRLVSALAAMALGMTVPVVATPLPAQAATPPVASTAQALRASIKLLPGVLGGVTLTANTTGLNWSTGQNAKSAQDGVTPLLAGVLGPTLLDAGLTKANAGPTSGGGGSSSEVAGLNVLGAVTADVIRSSCALTPSGITGGTTATNLQVAGLPVTIDADLNINVPGVLTGIVDSRVVGYNNTTGALTYTVRGVDISLLGGLSAVAAGTVVITEATCTGNAKISGGLSAAGVSKAPGQSGTPTVTLTNTGDVAAPNTTIKIPAPPVGYQIGPGVVTTTGGGTCGAPSGGFITCTNITVPGNDSVTVSLPVTLTSSSPIANWAPAAGTITANSDLVVGVGGVEATAATAAATPLMTVLPPLTTGGSITVTPVSIAAGASGSATLAVKNNGPSDAENSTVTVPLTALPTGVTVTAANAAGQPCTVTAASVSCTNVPIAAGASTPVTLTVAAGQTAVAGSNWDVTAMSAVMNGTTVNSNDRLATVSPPDVRFTGGITLTGVNAVPGGSSATFTAKFVNNGPSNSVGTTITFPPLPTGYTPGTMSTTGGGTCTSTSQAVTCTGVLIPGGGGSVTVSIPVTLASSVTSAWVASAGNRVSVSGSGSTAYATGTLVTPTPQWNLVPTFQVPTPETVEPGESTQITVTVDNTGPSDANQATFGIIAPTGSQFPNPLTGTATNYCTRITATQLSCKMDLTVTETPKSFVVPLDILDSADPTTPLTGGCVDKDGSLNCTAADTPIPPITLQVPFEQNVTALTLPTPLVPGTSSIGEVVLSAGYDNVDDAIVVIPLDGLPNGVDVTAATAGNGSNCVLTPAVKCTGVDIAENGSTRVRLTIRAASGVVPNQTWQAANISAAETAAPDSAKVTLSGPLATISARQNALDVQFQVPAPGIVEPGAAFNITVTVTDNGPSDAVQFPIQIIAPVNTVIGDRTNTPLANCILSAPGRLVCMRDIADGNSLALVVPLIASPTADPTVPLTSGCVDVGDHDLNCDPEDKKIPNIVMSPRFVDVVSVSTVPVTISPGESGTTKVVVTASQQVTGVVVTIPLSSLPNDFDVTGVTASDPAAQCVVDLPNSRIRCTGVSVGSTGQASITISVAVDVAANVAPTTQWSSTNITVAESALPGADTLQAGGSLVQAGARDFDLAVSVSGPPADTVLPGGSTSLSVTIDNTGPSNAVNAPVNIFAPVGATFGDLAGVVPTGDICTRVSATQLACTITLTAAAAPMVLPIPLGISASADPSAPLTGGCVDVNADLDCLDAVDKPIPPIDLDMPIGQVMSITTLPATVSPGAVTPGTVTVRLTSTMARSNLKLEIPLDALPSTFHIVAASATGPSGACPITTFITCDGVSIGANQSIDVTFQATVDPGALATDAWSSNAVKVTQTLPTAQVLSGGGPLVYAGTPNYVLDVSWVVPAAGTVLPGGSGEITATVLNKGPAAAVNAVVPIILPPGTALDALTDNPTATRCAKVSARVLNCVLTINTVNGTATLKVPFTVAPTVNPDADLTGGCADLNRSGACDPAPTDSPILPIDLGRTLAQATNVEITSATVTPGSAGVATLKFTSTQAYPSLTLTVPLSSLPSGYAVGTVTADGVTCTVTQTSISCPISNLAAATPRTVSIALSAAADMAGSVAWAIPSFTLANGSDTTTRTGTVAVTGAPVHPLAITILGPAPDTVKPGTDATMSISIDNEGPSDAQSLPVSIIAPTGTSFETLSGRAAQICQRVSNTRLLCGITLTAAAVNPEAFNVKILVSPNARGDATIGGGCVDEDNNGVCDPADEKMPVIDPNLLLITALDGHLQLVSLVPGSTGQAVLTLTGEETVPGLIVTFPTTNLPLGVELESVSADGQPCTINNSLVTCPAITVPENGEKKIIMNFKAAPDVSQSAVFGTSITTTYQPGPNQQTDAQGGRIVQIAPPQYVLAAGVTSPQANTVLPGEQAPLTITVTNNGPSKATNAPFSVIAPTGTTFVDPLDPTTELYCDRASPTQLDCWVTQNPGAPAIVLTPKIQIPANADLNTPSTPGCVDLNNDGACSGNDKPVPGVVPLAPLSAIATMTTSAARVKPGESGPAKVSITSTQLVDGQTLTIPMTGRPNGFSVTAASFGSTPCTVNPLTEISCTPISVTPGTTTEVSLTVAVAANVTDVLEWRPTSITLSGSRGTTGISGTLAFSIRPEQNITVTVGDPTKRRLTKNMTTTIPVTLKNNGPLPAMPAVVDVWLPNGMEPATLTGLPCILSQPPRGLTCSVNLPDSQPVTIFVEMKVSASTPVGTKPSGGCVDADTNGNCTGVEDDPMPTFEVAPSGADLTVKFQDPTVDAVRGGLVEVALPVGNLGLDPADNTTIEVDLPPGVGATAARRESQAATVQSMSDWGLDEEGISVAAAVPAVPAVPVSPVRLVPEAADQEAARTAREEAALQPGQTLTFNGGTCTVNYAGDLDCAMPDQVDSTIDILYLTLEVASTVPVGNHNIVARALTTTQDDQSSNNTAVAVLSVSAAPAVVPPVTGGGGGGGGGTGGSGGSGSGGNRRGHGWGGGWGGDGDGLAKTGVPIQTVVLYGMVLIGVGVLVRFGARPTRRRRREKRMYV